MTTETTNLEIPKHKTGLLDSYKEDDKKRLTADKVKEDKSLLDKLPNPTGYRMLVLPHAGARKTKGGILLADTTLETMQMTTVCAYVLKQGDLCYQDKEKFPNGAWCKEGEFVIYGRYSGSRFQTKYGEHRILNDDEIIGTIGKPEDILHLF